MQQYGARQLKQRLPLRPCEKKKNYIFALCASSTGNVSAPLGTVRYSGSDNVSVAEEIARSPREEGSFGMEEVQRVFSSPFQVFVSESTFRSSHDSDRGGNVDISHRYLRFR